MIRMASKLYFYTTVMVFGLLVLSCSRQEPESVPAPVRYAIEASVEEENPAVKTMIDPNDESKTKIVWTEHEQVGLFSGSETTYPYLFTGYNDGNARSTTFVHEGTIDMGEYYYLVTPYRASSHWNNIDVFTTLPAAQVGYPGGYAPGTAILAGMSPSSSSSVRCLHVCSGIRFRMSSDNDITSVTLSGNAGEGIAGDFSFYFNNEGNPSIKDQGSSKSVTLTSTDSFEPDTWYYITCLPTVFNKGFTLSAVSPTKGVGVYQQIDPDNPVRFNRARFKSKDGLDGDGVLDWNSPTISNTCYGPANTIVLAPNGSASIDVTPKFILPGWLRSDIPFEDAHKANKCITLWGDDKIDKLELSPNGSTLTLKAKGDYGSALVAIKKDDTILWSFLVWVTESEPDAEDLGGDLFFQWGRKDPLLKNCTHANNQNDGGLTYSIQNPTEFIDPEDDAKDWYTGTTDHNDNTLWRTDAKTVWDPCPAGYRLPKTGTTGYAGHGFISKTGGGSEPGSSWNPGVYYWTADSHVYSSYYGKYFSTSEALYTQFHYFAMPVRCIKE